MTTKRYVLVLKDHNSLFVVADKNGKLLSEAKATKLANKYMVKYPGVRVSSHFLWRGASDHWYLPIKVKV